MSNKTIITIIIIALAIGGYYWLVSNDSFINEITDTTKEGVGEQSELDLIVLGFLEKYDINTETPRNPKYTFQFEDGFVTTGKPIIFTGVLDDIFREDGEFYLRFVPAFFDFAEPRQFYTVQGCGDRIDEIVKREHSLFGEYVVVANITSVKRPIVRIDGITTGSDEVELELGQATALFAEGVCLDLEYIEDSTNLFN